MDSDLIKLGAYVVIILAIGGASVIKKIIESQKRRKEMEKTQVKTLRLDVGQPHQAEVQTQTVAPEPENEVTLESESDTGSGQRPKIEDILKEVFNIPTVAYKRSEVIKEIQRKPKASEPAQKVPQVSPMVEDGILGQTEPITSSAEPNWEIFATGLKNRELTEIQRAIVMTELIQKPRSRKRIF